MVNSRDLKSRTFYQWDSPCAGYGRLKSVHFGKMILPSEEAGIRDCKLLTNPVIMFLSPRKHPGLLRSVNIRKFVLLGNIRRNQRTFVLYLEEMFDILLTYVKSLLERLDPVWDVIN